MFSFQIYLRSFVKARRIFIVIGAILLNLKTNLNPQRKKKKKEIKKIRNNRPCRKIKSPQISWFSGELKILPPQK